MRGASNGQPGRFICWNTGVLIASGTGPEANEARFQSFIPLLEGLKSKGCSNLLISTRPWVDAKRDMDMFEMGQHFDKLFTKEDVAASSLVRYLSILRSLGLDASVASDRMVSVCRSIEEVPLDIDLVSLIYPKAPAPALVGEMLSLMFQGSDSILEAHTTLQQIPASQMVELDSIRGRLQLQSGAIIDVGLVQNQFSPLQWNRIMTHVDV